LKVPQTRTNRRFNLCVHACRDYHVTRDSLAILTCSLIRSFPLHSSSYSSTHLLVSSMSRNYQTSAHNHIAPTNFNNPPPPYYGTESDPYDLTPTPQHINRPRLPEHKRNPLLRDRACSLSGTESVSPTSSTGRCQCRQVPNNSTRRDRNSRRQGQSANGMFIAMRIPVLTFFFSLVLLLMRLFFDATTPIRYL
jgi:hypothetical protein